MVRVEEFQIEITSPRGPLNISVEEKKEHVKG